MISLCKICAENLIHSVSSGEGPYRSHCATIIRLVSSSTQLPVVQLGANFCSLIRYLALILLRDPMAFSSLDLLYIRILSKLSDGSVYVEKRAGPPLIMITVIAHNLAEVIEDIFMMEEGELKTITTGLSSLMKDEKDECLRGLSSPSIQLLGLIPCQLTGISKPGYYMELGVHYAIDSDSD